MEKYLNQIYASAIDYAPRILLAVITLLVGFQVVKIITNLLIKTLEKQNTDITVRNFLKSFLSVSLKIAVLISAASVLGVKTTSFVAILGAAGLAVGLALQGSLSNFAGGVLILIFRPYRVGHFIEAQGHSGIVHDIQIFNTILKTPDNKTIVVPNGKLANSSIVNYSVEPQRRVDMVFGIGYNDDIAKAKGILNSLIQKDSRILNTETRQPFLAVSELADSSVNFVVRVWVNAPDYWGVFFAMQEQVKLNFDQQGISIPYPQQDVHVHQIEKN